MGRVRRRRQKKVKEGDEDNHRGARNKNADNSRVYDDMPPHIDTQPLPRKLRQLMESGGEGKRSRDEQGHSNKDIKTTQHVSTNRRRHLQQWKQKHKMKKRLKSNKKNKPSYQDLVKFGEVASRPPELPGKSKSIKLCHLTFMGRT